MPKYKSDIEFSNIVKERFPDYKVIGTYINSKTKIEIMHIPCNVIYNVIPTDFLRGRYRCPNCVSKKRKKSNTKDFINKINKIAKGYKVLGEYKNNSTKIKIKHLDCNYEYDVTPAHFIGGRRCPKCNGGISYTNAQFINKLKEVSNNEYTPCETYINSNTPIKLKHSLCSNEFLIRPSNFFSGQRCPICQKNNNKSKGESLIENYLIGNNISYFYNGNNTKFDNCFIERVKKSRSGSYYNMKYKLPFDFYIKDFNLLIEFDGKQHFEPWKGKKTQYSLNKYNKVIENDKIKNKFAINNNMNIIRISYKEINNINTILDNAILDIKNNKKVQRLSVKE